MKNQNITPKAMINNAIVLAAGQGTRMRSKVPKIVTPVGGTPMIERVVKSLSVLDLSEIRLVVSPKLKETIQEWVDSSAYTNVKLFVQEDPQGTAHAVACAKPETLTGMTMIVNGDHPLVSSHEVLELNKQVESNESLYLLTYAMMEPNHFGRILRDSNLNVVGIKEFKDCTEVETKIPEVNVGCYILDAELLSKLIPLVSNKNVQSEYYLTDIVSLALKNGSQLKSLEAPDSFIIGVNTPQQWSEANQLSFYNKAISLLQDGVKVWDPENTYIEESVIVGEGTEIEPHVHIKGLSKIGSGVKIESSVRITDSIIGDDVLIKQGCQVEGAHIKSEVSVGPFSRLREGTILEPKVKIGNFCEIKKTHFQTGAKSGHFSYIGDTEVGESVNIGAGTVTCNYAADKKKYKTELGKGVFVGSGSMLVAPLKVGEGCVIGAGSTITKDVPEKSLAIARGKQRNIEGYIK